MLLLYLPGAPLSNSAVTLFWSCFDPGIIVSREISFLWFLQFSRSLLHTSLLRGNKSHKICLTYCNLRTRFTKPQYLWLQGIRVDEVPVTCWYIASITTIHSLLIFSIFLCGQQPCIFPLQKLELHFPGWPVMESRSRLASSKPGVLVHYMDIELRDSSLLWLRQFSSLYQIPERKARHFHDWSYSGPFIVH